MTGPMPPPLPSTPIALRKAGRLPAFIARPGFGLLLTYVGSAFAGLLVWQAVASQVPGVVLASPLAVLRDLLRGLFVTHATLFALLDSLRHMLVGFAIAFNTAVPLGFLMGRYQALEKFLQPSITLLYSVPPVAFVPFMIVWFGLDFWARVALVVLMSFFEILYVVTSGVRTVSPRLLDVARSFSAGRLDVLAKVLVPASLPTLFTALRVGLVRAVNAMITAELFFAAVNLGKLMKDSAEAFDTAGLLAIVALLCLLGLATQEALKLVEEQALPWRVRRAS